MCWDLCLIFSLSLLSPLNCWESETLNWILGFLREYYSGCCWNWGACCWIWGAGCSIWVLAVRRLWRGPRSVPAVFYLHPFRSPNSGNFWNARLNWSKFVFARVVDFLGKDLTWGLCCARLRLACSVLHLVFLYPCLKNVCVLVPCYGLVDAWLVPYLYRFWSVLWCLTSCLPCSLPCSVVTGTAGALFWPVLDCFAGSVLIMCIWVLCCWMVHVWVLVLLRLCFTSLWNDRDQIANIIY